MDVIIYLDVSIHSKKFDADVAMLMKVENKYSHTFNLILAYETARLHLTKSDEEILRSANMVADKLKIQDNTPVFQLMDMLEDHYNETSPQDHILLFSKVLKFCIGL